MTDPLTTLEGEEPVWHGFHRHIWKHRGTATEAIVPPEDIISRIRALQEERNALEASVKECPDCGAYFPHHQADCDLYVEMERFLKLQERVRELETELAALDTIEGAAVLCERHGFGDVAKYQEKLAKAARLYGHIHPDFRDPLVNVRTP